MRREDFEHVIRAAAAIVSDEIVVIGSQAVLVTSCAWALTYYPTATAN